MSHSVLVVDDDATFRDLATQVLTNSGFLVVGEAAGVEEALARAAELRPDTALVDIGLPDGNGFDLARRLSALEWPPRVVLISTDATATSERALSRSGATGFLAKHQLTGRALRQLLEDT